MPTYRRRAFAARPPGREPPSAVLREQDVTQKLSRRRSPASPGADRPPARSMLPSRELASSGIDLDAVPAPRIDEIFGPGTSTRPMPEQAARSSASMADRSSGPTAATPSAVPRPPGHMPPPTFIRRHIPAQSVTQICPLRASHADRQGPAPYRHASSHDCRVNCGLRSADRRGRRLSRSRGAQRLERATDMSAVARQKAAGRLCAVRADLPGLCQRHRRCMRPQIPGLAPGGLGPHRTSSGSPAGFPPVSRLPAGLSPSPAVPGFPSSGVLRFVPFGRCPVPVLRRFPSGFPSLSNLHVSAAAGRFRRRRSRAAGTKVTSPAATTSPGSRDPPALQMGSGRARWDAAAQSPVTSGRERRTPRPEKQEGPVRSAGRSSPSWRDRTGPA